MTKDSPPATDPIITRLDQIEIHLRNIDRRDRMRMIGSSIRSAVSLGMLAFVIWSSWYLFAHLEDLMKYVVQESAKQSQEMMKGGSEDFLKQFQQYFKK